MIRIHPYNLASNCIHFFRYSTTYQKNLKSQLSDVPTYGRYNSRNTLLNPPHYVEASAQVLWWASLPAYDGYSGAFGFANATGLNATSYVISRTIPLTRFLVESVCTWFGLGLLPTDIVTYNTRGSLGARMSYVAASYIAYARYDSCEVKSPCFPNPSRTPSLPPRPPSPRPSPVPQLLPPPSPPPPLKTQQPNVGSAVSPVPGSSLCMSARLVVTSVLAITRRVPRHYTRPVCYRNESPVQTR